MLTPPGHFSYPVLPLLLMNHFTQKWFKNVFPRDSFRTLINPWLRFVKKKVDLIILEL